MSRRARRRRFGWWDLAIPLTLAGILFTMAPSLLAPIVANRLSVVIGGDVRIGWITWNPMAGRVVLHHVALAPRTGEAPIVTLASLTVDVAVRRWLAGEHALDAVVLQRPWVSLRRTGPGDFNLASLVPTPRTPGDDTIADVGPPVPFRIGALRVVNGSVEFHGETIQPALATSLHLDDATARDLVVAGGATRAFAFHVESRLENEPLVLDVDYDTTAESSQLEATLVATGASLARALLYVPLGWQRTSGTMDVTVTYRRRVEKTVLRQHGLTANITLHDLALTEPWAPEPMLRAAHVRVPALAVDFLEQRTDLGALQIEDFQALVTRDADGMHVPLATAAPGTEHSGWETHIDHVTLGKGTALLRHVFAARGPDVVVPLASGSIRLSANDVSFAFAGSVADGRITLEGNARGAATVLNFGLDDVALGEACRLLDSPLAFERGHVDGTLLLQLGETGPQLSGTLHAMDARTTPAAPHPEEVLAWQRLDVTMAESPLAPLHLRLADVTATWPYVMVHRRSDGWFPSTLVETSPTTAASDAGTSSALRVDRLTVQGGRLEFYDSTLPEPYGIDLTDLVATAHGVSLSPLRIDRLDLTGALDELSPLTLGITIGPARTDAQLFLDRLILPSLNEYLAPLLGYEVKTGLARVASTIGLEGSMLEADADVVLSRFAMRAAGRDTVEATIGAPLSVTLAMMKDTHGDIHLQLPIRGNLTANQYHVGNLAREALGNVLLGTLRGPLGFVRSLFTKDAGEQFDLRPIPFAAGSATLSPEGEQRIAEVARLLARQTALRAVLIPDPSHADLEQLRDAASAQPLDALAVLARSRAVAVMDRLTRAHAIDPRRVAAESWRPTEPSVQGDPGVDVQLLAD